MSGEIDGIEVGATFASRKELHNAGIHRGLMRGIAPKGYSIVLSGGYQLVFCYLLLCSSMPLLRKAENRKESKVFSLKNCPSARAGST